MSYNSKVVSFERSAAYVHHRAMKNRRDNNPVDALELLRQAVEQSPENREYRLDLAEMYCEMGCHEQSNRILLDLLAQGDAPAECYYGLALNRLGRNEPDAARRALTLYHRHAKEDDPMAGEVNALCEEMEIFDALRRPSDRKKNRAVKIAMRACEAMKADAPEKAVRLFCRSLEMDPAQSDMRSLYAMALHMLGSGAEALAQAQRCLQAQDAGVRALSVLAQVYFYCGDQQMAETLANRAIDMHPEGVELRLMIFALSEMGMHLKAAEALRTALREAPHDKMLLHMRAVALHRSGSPDEKLASFWARILRIDPADSVAQYYYEAALCGKLREIEPRFIYEVPGEEFRRRLTLIAEKLSEGVEHTLELWRSDESFRALLLWAVGTGDENCGRAAVMIIASAADEESESLLRELLYRGEVPVTVKIHAMLFLRLRGADMEKLMPPDMDVKDGMLPEPAVLLDEMPVGERQLVRYADEVLTQEYGTTACSALALMWQAYRQVSRRCSEVLLCTQEAAAALAWNYLLSHGRRVAPGRLAHQFRCNPRRMVYYARRMAAVLAGYEGNKDDEDH